MVRPAGHMYAPGVPLSSPEKAWSLWMGGEYGDLMKGGIEKNYMCDSVVHPKYVTQECGDSKW